MALIVPRTQKILDRTIYEFSTTKGPYSYEYYSYR